MALSSEEQIALGVVAVALVIYVTSKSSGGGTSIVATGPSESTSRELIRASVETQRTQASLERDIAGIYTNGVVALTGIESRERIASATLNAQERTRTRELTTQERIASILGETERFRAQTAANTQQAAIGVQSRNGIFDFISRILPIFFQEGGDITVDRPTMIVVGEGGLPERVRITPLRGYRRFSGGGTFVRALPLRGRNA